MNMDLLASDNCSAKNALEPRSAADASRWDRQPQTLPRTPVSVFHPSRVPPELFSAIVGHTSADKM